MITELPLVLMNKLKLDHDKLAEPCTFVNLMVDNGNENSKHGFLKNY